MKNTSDNSAANFTILGANGFVGTHLTNYIRKQGYICQTPTREESGRVKTPLGHVIYTIGLTADFRKRPFETVEAHVCILKDLLANADFKSLTYLSSTRFYQYASMTSEDTSFEMNPNRADSIYDLSKLMGESLCQHSGRPNIKIARLSNIIGIRKDNDIFVDQILSDIICKGAINLHDSLDSAKDYIWIGDVVKLLANLAVSPETGCFNIASGTNTTNRYLLEKIRQQFLFDLKVSDLDSFSIKKTIDISRITKLYEFKATPFDIFFPNYLKEFKQIRGNQ